MKQAVISVKGGLDLVSEVLAADPGTARKCENYEVAVRDGIRRIAGFSRWDGRENWIDSTVAINVLAQTVDASPTGWVLGSNVTATYESRFDGSTQTITAVVVSPSDDDNQDGTYTHSAIMAFATFPPDWPDLVSGQFSGTFTFSGSPSGPYQVNRAYLPGNGYQYYADDVTALPGDSNVRIPGLHWFNDKLYAVVDLTAMSVNIAVGTGSTMLKEGAELYSETQDDLVGVVASLSTPDANEYVTLELFDCEGLVPSGARLYAAAAEAITEPGFDSSSGWTAGAGWSIANGIATATASSANLTSSFSPTASAQYRVEFTILSRSAGSVAPRIGLTVGTSQSAPGTYVQFLTAATTSAFALVPSGFTGTIDNVSVKLIEQVAELQSYTTATRAAMYCADWNSAGGWNRVDLGRVLAFKETASTSSTAFFLPYNRRGFIDQYDSTEIQDTGWIGASEWTELTAGGAAWTGTGTTDLQSQDGTTVGAALGPWTNWIKATFGGVSVPGGCIITAVQIRIYRYKDGPNNVRDSTVAFGVGDLQGANHAALDAWPVMASAAWKEYGSATSNSWGLAISPDDVNSGNMFAYLRCLQETGSNGVVDSIAVKVYYQPQTRKCYVYDSAQTPTDQEIDVIHYAVSKGNSTDNNREGVIVINPTVTPANAYKPWQFAPGQQIRTQTGGAGTLLAEVASVDSPVTLPSHTSIEAESARYVFWSANPYATDLLDVLFIASGVENAYMFDGQYALPIRTGLIDTYEKPRHVTWARNFLALGYRSGSVAVSDTGDPLVFVSTSSVAAEIGQGDRITGLVPMRGNSLGVFTESSIATLKGDSPTALTMNLISATSGAIEYTVVYMGGQVMFCDRQGIGTITSTDQYGDFNAGRLTWRSAPWLMRRLQQNLRDTEQDIGLICAYVKRDSNQYRVLFKDGWQASLTIPATADKEPQLTTQHFYGNVADRDSSGIRFLAVATGVTSGGKDVAFASFGYDKTSSRYRYVFQLDSGRGFDGVDIYAYWETQPLLLGAPFYAKSLDQIGLIGMAYGYADLTVYVAADFTSPDVEAVPAQSRDFAFGLSASYAASTESHFRFLKSIGAEGEDFTVGIESQTQDELPHAIQSVIVRYQPREPKA